MAYIYENYKALYNVSHCYCHFSGKFCYEMGLFLNVTLYVEQVFDGNSDQIWRKIKYLLRKNNKRFYYENQKKKEN